MCSYRKHFITHSIPKLTINFFTKAFHATNSVAKTKSVPILIGRDSGFELTQQLADPEGLYLFLKGKIGNLPITLANVYFPNTLHIFCNKIIDHLSWFASGCTILGGGFNIQLDPLQHTSNGKSAISFRILKRIKVILNSLTLVDSWSVANPQGRDFT